MNLPQIGVRLPHATDGAVKRTLVGRDKDGHTYAKQDMASSTTFSSFPVLVGGTICLYDACPEGDSLVSSVEIAKMPRDSALTMPVDHYIAANPFSDAAEIEADTVLTTLQDAGYTAIEVTPETLGGDVPPADDMPRDVIQMGETVNVEVEHASDKIDFAARIKAALESKRAAA